MPKLLSFGCNLADMMPTPREIVTVIGISITGCLMGGVITTALREAKRSRNESAAIRKMIMRK